jgi:chaperonin GroES
MANNISARLQTFIDSKNIADLIPAEKLVKIAAQVVEDTKQDMDTTITWRKTMNEALKVAKQIIEGKSFPHPNAADIKYPLMLTACREQNSRLFPEIVQNEEVVKIDVINEQPSQAEMDRADRLSAHMSYQLFEEVPNWISDTDKLTMVLPMMGTVFRKSYFDPIEKRPQVDLCLPNDIIINNNASGLENTPITHILHLTTNQLIERMRAGIFIEYSLEELGLTLENRIEGENKDQYNPISLSLDEDYQNRLYKLYERHMWLDLDNDNYEEPYIVTIHPDSQKVLRIMARYDEDSFLFNENTKKFIRIVPIQSFTDYHFLRSPDGSYLSLGFGALLYPVNATINSLLNQLVDAGTLANMQGGFYSDSLRLIPENLRFTPGEWKKIRVPPGSTVGEHLFPLPINPPSMALINLLQIMMDGGKEVASVTDVMMGQQPPPNTPATTVMAMVEQGTKTYSTILRRLYYSLKSEYQKLYNINKKYLEAEESFYYAKKLGVVSLEDYQQPNYGVFPVADPSMSSQAMKLAQSQALMQLAENPMINQYEVLRRFLISLKVPDIDKILPPEEDPTKQTAPPPPSPEDLLAEAKMENVKADTQYKRMQSAKIMADMDATAIELELKEKQQMTDAASQGANVLSQKINGVTQLAQTDALLGEKEVARAERQANILQQQIPVANYQKLDQRIVALEQLISQISGVAGGQQEQAQQALPPAGGLPPQPAGSPAAGAIPGGTPTVGQPPQAGAGIGTALKPAEEMAPAKRAAEAEEAGSE